SQPICRRRAGTDRRLRGRAEEHTRAALTTRRVAARWTIRGRAAGKGSQAWLWPRSVLAVGLCARTHRLGHCPVFDSKINRGILGAHARGGLPRGLAGEPASHPRAAYTILAH